MKTPKVHLFLFFLAVLTSCSIKEDRSLCPCLLEVDTKDLSSESVVVQLRRGEVFLEESINREDYSLLHEYKVPRGWVELSAVSGMKNLGWDGDNYLRLARGRQMDSLYCRLSSIDTHGERAYDKIILHKNFATLTFSFIGSDSGRIDDFSLVIRGESVGVDLRDLSPIEGGFECVPSASDKGGYILRLPRQEPQSSLNMELLYDGVLYDTIDIGDLILRAGFDWKREDLGDIHIEANLPESEFKITVIQWEGPVTTSITI